MHQAADPVDRTLELSLPGPARASPFEFQMRRSGPAHDIGGEVDETRALYGLARQLCWPSRRLTGRVMVWHMCYPVLKGEGICADVFSRCTCAVSSLFIFPLSGFRGLPHEPHAPTTGTKFQQKRPALMASVPTGGLLPLSAAAAPKAAAARAASDICCCNTRYLQPAAALRGIATPGSFDLSSERSNYNSSDRLSVVSHDTAAIFTLGSTTTRTKVNIATTFGHVKGCPLSGPTSRRFNGRFRPD